MTPLPLPAWGDIPAPPQPWQTDPEELGDTALVIPRTPLPSVLLPQGRDEAAGGGRDRGSLGVPQIQGLPREDQGH